MIEYHNNRGALVKVDSGVAGDRFRINLKRKHKSNNILFVALVAFTRNAKLKSVDILDETKLWLAKAVKELVMQFINVNDTKSTSVNLVSVISIAKLKENHPTSQFLL